MSESRTANAVKNSVATLVLHVLQLLFSFINRTVFIRLLNPDYLGIQGLFSNILTILSLAELGVGTAVIYAMYKPVSEGNQKKIAAYINYYTKLYRCIGLIIITVGLCVLPFLNHLIKDTPDIVENIKIIYLLVLADTAGSYFFSAKRSLFLVYQKGRIDQLFSVIGTVVRYVLQIVVLLLTRSIYAYFAVQLLTTIATAAIASKRAVKGHEYLRDYKKEEITSSEKRTLRKNITAMFASKIGSVAVNGTDNIIISAFLGIGLTGIYANYIFVTSYIKSFFSKAITAVTASVGNLVASSDTEHIHAVFRKTYFLNSVIAFFATVYLAAMIDPFIRLWAGESYIMSLKVVWLLVINFYFGMMRQTTEVFINSFGLFWQLRWKPIVESIINIALSLILVIFTDMGLLGVIIGTVLSNIMTNVWWEPYALFKYGFKLRVSRFYKTYIIDLIACFVACGISVYLSDLVQVTGNIMHFFVRGFAATVCSAIIFVVVYVSRKEYRNMLKQYFQVASKFIRRRI